MSSSGSTSGGLLRQNRTSEIRTSEIRTSGGFSGKIVQAEFHGSFFKMRTSGIRTS